MADDPKNGTVIDPNWTPPVQDTTAAPAPKADEPDPIEELKAQLAAERQARVEAERRVFEESQRAHKATVEVADSQLNLVLTAISNVKESTTALKGAYAEALKQGDFDAAADIQVQISDNAAKLLQLENGKAAMEARPKPQAPTRNVNPVEAFASQLTPRSAAWVRSHPEYVTDQRLNQKMLAAHNLAVADGIRPDTDEYFAAVEGTLGVGRKAAAATDGEDAMSSAARPAARDTAPPAAPPSRGGSNGRSARLSADEMEIAALSGMSPEEYAKQRERINKERMH